MTEPATVMLVEDERGSLITLTALLEAEGYEVKACETAEKALNYMAAEGPLDLVLSDLKLPDGSGLQLLWALKKINPDAAFILTTGYASVETAVEAVNEGAFAYHVKPIDVDALLSNIRNAIRQRRLMIENRSLLKDLQRTNEDLVENNLALERASHAKTQILATVTHELKTPLTSVVGYVDRLLLDQDKLGTLNEKQERYLDRVQINSRRLQALIDDLLDISRIETGTLQLTLTDLEVRWEIEDVVRAMRAQLDDKQLRLLLNLPSGLLFVRSDRLRFAQIVSNLLSNACKYSPDGATVAISAKPDDGFIRIDIADTGIGISQGDQSQLFTKFFRSDNSSTRRESGTGLGLFITKHIVEAQGGGIWVQSLEGKGSTFSFTLPKADGSTAKELGPFEENAPESPPIPGSGLPSDGTRPTDDEEMAEVAEVQGFGAGDAGEKDE